MKQHYFLLPACLSTSVRVQVVGVANADWMLLR